MPTAVRDEHEAAEYVISPELQQELLKHPGKWVAMDRTRILEIGESPEDVLARARARGHQHPIIYRVLEAGTTYFF